MEHLYDAFSLGVFGFWFCFGVCVCVCLCGVADLASQRSVVLNKLTIGFPFSSLI